MMHPQTHAQVMEILTMLAEKGEKETFRCLKEEVLTGKPFPWEQTEDGGTPTAAAE